MTLPGGRRGQVLAWALALAIGVAAAAAIALPAWWAWSRYQGIAAESESRIERYQRIASARADLQRALDAIKAREASRFFLKNTASTQAGAELTELVRSAVEGQGGRLTSVQPATVKDDAGYRLYTLPVGFVATPANMTRVLLALETGLPYLLFDSVTLRATVPRGYKGVPNVEPEVSLTLEVQAYGPRDPARASAPRASGSGAASPTPAAAPAPAAPGRG